MLTYNLFSPVLFWSYWARAAAGQSAEVHSLPQLREPLFNRTHMVYHI
jgi:hypothetical protein